VPEDVPGDFPGEVVLGDEGSSRDDTSLQDREELFDLVEPGAVLGREMERPTRMSVEPVEHVVGVVRGLVVADEVTLAGRVASRHDIEQLDERPSPGLSAINPKALPARASKAPISATVPWRMYSNSRLTGAPAFIGTSA
jgi:hypothetical protein